ncbi:MAG: malate dehydrogenase [Acidobacteriota bacterium]
MRNKVTIVGAGHVGASAAQRIAEKQLADVILVDIIEGVPQGKALDLLESAPVEKTDAHLLGTNTYSDTADSDIVVITAGLPRKPGMSRDDLLQKNRQIVEGVVKEVSQHSPESILIIVTNPLDAMAQLALRTSGFAKQRVVGMAGILDTARFRSFIAAEAGVSVESVQALVLGGHGDSMVPLTRYCTIAGVPIEHFLPAEAIDRVVQRTRNGGAEIVNLLKTGSAYYAPGAAIVEMVESILLDKKKVLPCAAYLEGEYGFEGIFLGVPVILGNRGIERVVEIPLEPKETEALAGSAAAVKSLVGKLGL